MLLQIEKLTRIYFPWEFLSKKSLGLWAKNRLNNLKLDEDNQKLF